MKRKITIVLLASFFVMACYMVLPDQPSEEYAPMTKPVSQSIETLEVDGFTIVRLHPDEHDIQGRLADEAKNAVLQGLMPVVEFDATWCPPCKAIDTAIKEKNELMLEAYRGTYIIKLDVDEWGWGVADFQVEAIPIYFKVDTNGKPTGETIDGNAWGENIPENVAPPMDAFFHGG